MNRRSILILGGALGSLFSASAIAALDCTQAPDCASLGYTMTAADCTDGVKVACPTDTSKVFCEAVQSCNGQVGDIIYGNGACSSEIIPDQKPVAVIFDDINRFAVSLTYIDANGIEWDGVVDNTYSGVSDNLRMQWAESGSGDVPGLENCYVGMMGFFACGASGEANTRAILEYDGGKNIHHAALAVSKFKPSGCKAPFCAKGKWWLLSNKELSDLQQRRTYIENSFNMLSGFVTSPVANDRQVYWTSNESKQGAFQSDLYSDTGKYEWRLVRPVVKY